MNIHAGVGAGRYRKPWRIKEWLSENDLNMSSVARDLRLDPSIASRTVAGKSNNRQVLSYLREKGCPLEYLSLPKDMFKAGGGIR